MSKYKICTLVAALAISVIFIAGCRADTLDGIWEWSGEHEGLPEITSEVLAISGYRFTSRLYNESFETNPITWSGTFYVDENTIRLMPNNAPENPLVLDFTRFGEAIIVGGRQFRRT